MNGWRFEHTLALVFLGCCAVTGSLLGAAWALATGALTARRG